MRLRVSRFLTVGIVSVLLGGIIIAGGLVDPGDAAESMIGDAVTVVNEGNDFATLVLRDPWDMAEYSDVSQYINRSGQANQVTNIQAQDGVFSASALVINALIFDLFPGYETAMLLGKVGANYPISTTSYNCLYAAVKTDTSGGLLQFYWYKDEKLNGAGGVFGYSNDIAMAQNQWKLYALKLNDPNEWQGITRWSSLDAWRGLSFNPGKKLNNFSVDWVRLTDCAPRVFTINAAWTGDAKIYGTPQGTSREILLVDKAASTGSYALDVQGLQPGIYSYAVRLVNGSAQVASGSFEVNATPILRYNAPNFFTGADYATSAGNPWDFGSASDVVSTYHLTSIGYTDGVMQFTTSIPYADPQMQLNTPQNVAPPEYRYLTFRMDTSKPFQNVPQGMIARWIWTIPSLTGDPGTYCYLVSQDIPFDVGWQTYTVDLWDAFEGSVEQTSPGSPHCPALPTNWQSNSPAVAFRFDPNENLLNAPMIQQLDWIRLTKPDTIRKGGIYQVKVLLNKPQNEISTISFYYTSSLNSPKQNLAIAYNPGVVPIPPANSTVYLPLIVKSYGDLFVGSLEANVLFKWNTTTVIANVYYICAEITDVHNAKAIYCSEAAVTVTP